MNMLIHLIAQAATQPVVVLAGTSPDVWTQRIEQLVTLVIALAALWKTIDLKGLVGKVQGQTDAQDVSLTRLASGVHTALQQAPAPAVAPPTAVIVPAPAALAPAQPQLDPQLTQMIAEAVVARLRVKAATPPSAPVDPLRVQT